MLTGEEYQALVDQMKTQGMELDFLNTYPHGGRVYYSAIFAARIDRAQTLRHGMTSATTSASSTGWPPTART